MEIPPDDIIKICEKLGAAVHDMWRAARAKERGWHSPEDAHSLYGSECRISRNIYCDGQAMRNDLNSTCQKCHPCMRSWDQLDEKDKYLSRQYPKLFIEMINEMGYKIYKPQLFAFKGAILAEDDDYQPLLEKMARELKTEWINEKWKDYKMPCGHPLPPLEKIIKCILEGMSLKCPCGRPDHWIIIFEHRKSL